MFALFVPVCSARAVRSFGLGRDRSGIDRVFFLPAAIDEHAYGQEHEDEAGGLGGF